MISNTLEIPLLLKNLRFNVYTCQKCGRLITTVDIHEGVTPFMILCQNHPQLSTCDGNAYSSFYPDGIIPPHIPFPVLEWFKPIGSTFYKLSNEMKDHVRKGGLDMRPISVENLDSIKLAWEARHA